MGVGLAALILYLIRRDHLYLMHGLFWVLVAAAAVVLGVWPGMINRLATALGISYPPAMLLLLACIVLLIKALHADMVNTRIERDVRRLNQRLAMLEADAADLIQARPNPRPHDIRPASRHLVRRLRYPPVASFARSLSQAVSCSERDGHFSVAGHRQAARRSGAPHSKGLADRGVQ